MFIKRRRGWEIPERLVTPESVALSRRAAMGLAGAGVIAAGPAQAQLSRLWGGAPSAPVQPLKPLNATLNAKYEGKRAVTAEAEATSYNNYYEFGTSKSIHAAAQALPVEPWTIEIAGMVAKPRKIGVDELMKASALEERVYRMRCVEAWAMTVPWNGIPLADLVKLAEPLSGAKYVVFQTLADPKIMPGLKQSFYPWPYTDGCTLAEARNELAFLAVGLYGKTAPPQNGAPVRLVLPWKYGFKGVKSIVRVEFTDKRPTSFWEALQDAEYGFWANVNPAVPHPRWSQARERLLGTDEMVPTQIWNGYGEYVADMYENLKSERLFA